MNKFSLFIDELGIANPKAIESKLYVLTGIAVKKDFRDQLEVEANQIKFKYWNKTDIVFHSREIGKNLGDFVIFKNKESLKKLFINDLFNFLSNIPITIFSIVVDKNLAFRKNWNDIKILRETIRLLYFNFLTFLLGKNHGKGKIVVESATAEKDIYYLRYFAYFTSPNCKELNVDYKKIQNILTSISFVTKRNFDIEEQIADLFSYAGKCKYIKDYKNKPYASGSYENKIIKILNNKLFLKPKNLSAKKLKLYKQPTSLRSGF